MIELEKTFLLKEIPQGLEQCRKIENLDIYIPLSARHPILRLRKKGDFFEMTKKSPIANDKSEQKEQTISLSEEEFNELSKISGKRLKKNRYYYPWNNMTAELDLFQESLEGLVTIDFEFDSIEEKRDFIMPDFCLVEITQVEFFGGGYLAGKEYSDIKSLLEEYHYKKLLISD